MSSGNIYNFNLNITKNSVENGKEINFETDENGNVKVVFSSETNQQAKEISTNKNIDKRDLLIEER